MTDEELKATAYDVGLFDNISMITPEGHFIDSFGRMTHYRDGLGKMHSLPIKTEPATG